MRCKVFGKKLIITLNIFTFSYFHSYKSRTLSQKQLLNLDLWTTFETVLGQFKTDFHRTCLLVPGFYVALL